MTLGNRGLWIIVLAQALACSDDGVPATSDDPTSAGTTGSSDGDTVTNTTSASSTTGASDSDSAPESTASGPTTTGDTSGTATSPSDSSGSDGTGSESTTGDSAQPCEGPRDCVVVDDCCSCMAIAEGTEPPPCDKVCVQSACSALGIDPIAQCELGNCELAPASCNPFDVSCEAKPPECPEGTLPGVDPTTMCWTGACVPAELCDAVSSCADCAPDEACVEYQAQLVTVSCSPIPPECDGVPSCACMGDVCESPFDICGDEGDGITCACPAC